MIQFRQKRFALAACLGLDTATLTAQQPAGKAHEFRLDGATSNWVEIIEGSDVTVRASLSRHEREVITTEWHGAARKVEITYALNDADRLSQVIVHDTLTKSAGALTVEYLTFSHLYTRN